MQTSTSTEPVAALSSHLEDGAHLQDSPPEADNPARKRISSAVLLGSEREIEIQHGAQLYRLRLTALGKLILTK
ncbi:MAG: hemin uptake protein HemP [Paucibacter sp.]|nr:hemin uptake protein HemP [Roseateles sp.]